MPQTPRIGPLVVFALSTMARGQHVSSAVMVSNPSGETAREPVVIASGVAQNEVLVAWMSGGVIKYAISTDGAAHFGSPQTFHFDANDACVRDMVAGCDPMVAASATGDLHLGFLATDAHNTSGWFYVGRRPVGSTAQIHAVLATPCGVQNADRCLLAVGPSSNSPGAPEAMHIAYRSGSNPWSVQSSTTTPVGSHWPNAPAEIQPHGQHRVRHGPFPLVVPSGTHKGRVIVAYATTNTVSYPFCAPPAVTYSDDGGATWQQETALNTHGPSQPIAPVEAPVSIAGLPTQFPHAMPSAALDPNDPNTVYVAFCGGASPSATDVDLFISKGTPDAQTGVLEFSTCRVTGPQLGESPSGRYDLWLPSIAVDSFGGINLLYWRTASADPTPTPVGSVKYARFESFSQISSGQHASFSAVLSALVPQNTGAVFGDYHMLVSAGCGRLYAAWVTDQSGSPQAYVNRITLGSCPNPGDFDNNGLVNLDDLNAFLSAFSVGSASADVNQDQCTNSLDAITFIDAWRNSPH